MIILDATTKSLELTLGTAKTTTDMDVIVCFEDIDLTTNVLTPTESDTASNGTSIVTFLAAPGSGIQRRLKYLQIYNADTVLKTVTLKYNDNGTKRILWTGTLNIGQTLIYANGSWSIGSLNAFTSTIEFVIDGAGSVITTGLKGYLEIPFNCSILVSTLLADQSGSIVVDVWKTTYTSFQPGTHPVAADKITASAPPTISSTYKAQDSTLSGWTTAINAGDILAFNVNSVTTCQRVTISLKVQKT